MKGKIKTLYQTSSWLMAWKGAWRGVIDRSSKYQLFEDRNLYSVQHRLKNAITIKSLLPIGSHGPEFPSVRSEYWQFMDDSQIASILEGWKEQLIGHDSHQLIIPDLIANSHDYESIASFAFKNSLGVISRNNVPAYYVDTNLGSFSDYIASRGSSTRLKLFNRRKRLKSNGAFEITNMADDGPRFIDLLNDFHEGRWGKSCFSGVNREFIETLLLLLMKEDGCRVNLSVMKLNGEVASVLMDLEVSGCIYNLQSGYVENLIKGVSLGTLHLGFEIERAFNNPEIHRYDFMAGTGKNTNYKEKLATDTCELVELVLVKSKLLRLLYKINSWSNTIRGNGTNV